MKNLEKQKKGTEKGITLVALVVTIVVLLILAGITITMLFGENGIIKKAQDAADATKNTQDDTANGLANLENAMDEALGENGGGAGSEDTSGLAKLIKTGGKVENTTTVKDKTGKSITIPGGFTVTNITSEVDKGVVIKDDSNNEFVWVPVSDEHLANMYDSTNKRGKLYDFTTSGTSQKTYGFLEPDVVTGSDGKKYDNVSSYYTNAGITDKEGNAITTADQFKALLQSEFDDMIASVEKYKGFYIGRYETGDLNQTKAVVQKNNSNINNVNWYTMYQKSKGILSEENQKNATTSMIWGCQWDRTLQWLVDSGDKTYEQLLDSSSWGNYSNYSSTTGDTSTASGGSNPQPTGTNEAWQANHIYDLAGNVNDWTLEASHANYRDSRRRQFQPFFWFRQSSFYPRQRRSELQQQILSVLVSPFM